MIVEHKITERRERPVVGGFEIVIHCQCSAAWSHPKGTTDEEIESIFRSHVKYFDNKTVTL